MTDRQAITAFAILIFLALGAAYIMRPTPEDITKCVLASGYSEDRCKFELTR